MTGEPRLRIVATCSLCGHELPSWWDREAMDAHLAEAHGLYFDPKPLFGEAAARLREAGQ